MGIRTFRGDDWKGKERERRRALYGGAARLVAFSTTFTFPSDGELTRPLALKCVLRPHGRADREDRRSVHGLVSTVFCHVDLEMLQWCRCMRCTERESFVQTAAADRGVRTRAC
jgi:hypothetical protein